MKDDIKIKLKVYPYVDINRKDNHVGDIKVVMNTDNLPFTYFDQVDHMMHNLFGYVRDRDKPEKYFKNKTHEKVYNPPESLKPKIILGGKHRKTIKKSEKTRINKKSKKNKRKTYKR
jgi:hypothetical protein